MCGLTAIVSVRGAPIDRHALERMTQSIAHRGPDDSGFFVDESVGLGFRRLSILDLTPSGHQPMLTPDGRYVIAFNGEIFNFIELREELRARGYTFRSTGDTEVLLYAYREWGFDCLAKLNGMWAFVIYDTQTGNVFGARDRFGVKPLYYHRAKQHMLLASEIKAIRASGMYAGGTDWRTAAKFFVRGELDNSDHTFFDNILQIPAGHAFEIDRSGALTLRRFWDLAAIDEAEPADPAASFRDLFEDAVRLRLRSDVPVGVSLSGGLDSTSIICAVARLKAAEAANSAATLAFSFNVQEFDESRYIADTVAQTRVDLKQLGTDAGELWSSLDEVLWYHDEPVHSLTALVGYRIMKLAASNGVKVVLTGQGADETLAGYPSYFRNTWHSALRGARLGEFWSEINAFVATHGGSSYAHASGEVVKLAKSSVARLRPYRWLARGRQRRALAAHPWFTRELVEHLRDGTDTVPDLTLRGALRDSVEKSPLPLYLRIDDRNSMAHSVEARLPFMDYRLVSLAFSLPPRWKMRGPWNKYVLRESMRGRIPESVRARPDKMGFPTPTSRWFREQLFEPVSDMLRSRNVAERGIYRVDRIVADLDRHRRGEANVAHRLFDVVQFERWLAQCDSAAPVAAAAR